MQSRAFSQSELKDVAGEVLAHARTHETVGASILALHGDLGAGKTSLTQALAALLGVQGEVTSPTFVILKSYTTTDVHFRTLVHIDAYRLEGAEELAVLNFDDMVKDPHTLIVIEWAERVASLIPKDALEITLAHAPNEQRTLSYA